MLTSIRTALFVDLESIYYSLEGENERAADRFVTAADKWMRALEDGTLISGLKAACSAPKQPRRILVRRLYADPALLRSGRRHFTRAAFDVIDCPALTGTGKNASDIRMIMDIVAYLGHAIQFDEFVILSADADFTPVILKLREHDRRSVIFDNGKTASAYRTAADGFVDMDALVDFLKRNDEKKAMVRSRESNSEANEIAHRMAAFADAHFRDAPDPINLTRLATAIRKEVGDDVVRSSDWGGYQSFGKFLAANLPAGWITIPDRGGYAADPTRHQLQLENLAARPDPEIMAH